MNSNAKPVETGLKKLLQVLYEIQKSNVPNVVKTRADGNSQCLPPGHIQLPGDTQLQGRGLPEDPRPAVRETADKLNSKIF